jgi:hypothetical protein
MPPPVSRAAGLLLAALLALISIDEYLDLRAQNRGLTEILEAADFEAAAPGVLADLARQTDVDRARLVAARGLLGIETDPATFLELSPAARRERALAGVEHLRTTRLLAEEVMRTRPAAWEVHLIRGASAFLEQARTRSPRRVSSETLWEASLTLAHRLAPSRSEPPRFLGAAYLSDWSRLDETRRGRALAILEQAFEDPETFEILLDQWLRVAPSLTSALAILPDRSRVWERVRRHHADRRDWERYCLARRRGDEALLRELQDAIAEIPVRLKRGDVAGSRSALLGVLQRAPVRRPFDTILIDFLRLFPPGPASKQGAESLRRWLAWEVDLCLQGACEADRVLLDRLAGLAELEQSSRIAEAAVIAGDLPRAEIYERRSFRTGSREWTTYLLLKSRLLAERGRRTEAWETLSKINPTDRTAPEYAAAAAAVDGAALAEIPAFFTSRDVPVSEWSRTGRISEILVPGLHRDGSLEIDLALTSPKEGPIEIVWNGGDARCVAVTGSTRLQFQPPSWLDLNRLRIVPLEETRVRVGDVRRRSASRHDLPQRLPEEPQESPRSPAS